MIMPCLLKGSQGDSEYVSVHPEDLQRLAI